MQVQKADDVIDSIHDKHPNQIMLSAFVGPGSMKNAAYQIDLASWSAKDKSLYLIFDRALPLEFNEEQIYSAVNDLESILLALFVNDHIPRKIFFFNFPSDLDEESTLKLITILGNRHAQLPNEELLAKIFSQGGLIFNFKWQDSFNTVPSNQVIAEWFQFFSQNKSISTSIDLVQESFSLINQLNGNFGFYDYLKLSSAIILLVSGLESLFFQNSDDKADISFKFRVIGAIYYEKYVLDEFFKVFNDGSTKLSFSQMKNLFGLLYDIRSDIAHGRSPDVFNGSKKNNKRWNKFINLLHVAPVSENLQGSLTKIISFSLGSLEKHLLGLIYCSKENLIKGVKIVDEIFENQ
jgi:hypothetical protein